LRPADCRYKNIGGPGKRRQIFCPRMRDGDGCIAPFPFAMRSKANGLANDRAASENDHVRARDLDSRLEQ
jgi:hypothetical protein